MRPIENLVKFNAQTVARERLIRLCVYTTKFVNSILQVYYSTYLKGEWLTFELLQKLKELELYFSSCRQVVSFGRCIDQFHSAMKSLQLHDPAIRMALFTSKVWSTLQLFADHVLCLHQLGLLKVEKQRWVQRANEFWLYSVSSNLLRDIYELIKVVQQRRYKNNKDNRTSSSEITNYSLSTPFLWMQEYPRLSCDLIKNTCDFWIPYSAINKMNLHPVIVSTLGIVSTTMGIIQVYNKNLTLLPS